MKCRHRRRSHQLKIRESESSVAAGARQCWRRSAGGSGGGVSISISQQCGGEAKNGVNVESYSAEIMAAKNGENQ
jgi:hypothetical protein